MLNKIEGRENIIEELFIIQKRIDKILMRKDSIESWLRASLKEGESITIGKYIVSKVNNKIAIEMNNAA